MRLFGDYLRDCVTLGLDLEQRDVLFPQNLEQAHARTIAQIKHKANEEHRAAFQKQVEKYLSLLEAGQIEGIIFCSGCVGDAPFETNKLLKTYSCK